LVCSLLGIASSQQVKTYYSKGALFENLIINELLKNRIHKGQTQRFYFWKNKTKQEIDLIVDTAHKPFPVEIKSGMTLSDSYFSNLKYWQKLTGEKSKNLNVIYGGEINFRTSIGNYISWRSLNKIFDL
jgi:hypothetical protein